MFKPRLSKWPLHVEFLYKNPVGIFVIPIRVAFPVPLVVPNSIIIIIFGELRRS